MKVEKEREEKAEDEKDRNQWMTADRIYLETEKAKKQRQRDANMEVQKIQIQQMVNRKAVSPFSKKPIVLDLFGGRERNLAVGVMCVFCLFGFFNLCALQVLRLGTGLFSEQWSRSLFQADLAHAGWGGLPGRASNKEEINNDRLHPILRLYAVFSAMPLLLSCIFWTGHQRAAADADVHLAIQCTLYVGGRAGERRDYICQVSTSITADLL